MGQGRRDRLFPVVGGGFTIIGTLLLLLLGTSTTTVAASAFPLVIGAGVGLPMQSTLLTAMNSAALRDMGAATGSVTLVRTIGGSLGVAVLGAVYGSRMGSVLAERLGHQAADRLTAGAS